MAPHGWEELVGAFNERKITISTAESCTGGFISSHLTDISGASGCFKGGFIVYSDDLKMKLLGVKQETLTKHGAVSRETALEMSRGCLERTGSDMALSVTGIAGPTGGTVEKPVGTVYMSVFIRDGRKVTEGFLLEGLSRSGFKEEVARRAVGMMAGALPML